MKIGVIGSGNIGGTLGTLWAKAGHPVMFASRHPESLQNLLKEAGENAESGDVKQAAAFGEIILFAVPYPETENTLSPEVKDALGGKILIDARNPYNSDGSVEETSSNGKSATQMLTGILPGTHLVKAFNTLYWKTLAEKNHLSGDDLITIMVAGDDLEAKKSVASLIEDAGFTLLDVGNLDSPGAHEMEPGKSLYNVPLDVLDARAILSTL